MFAKLLRVSVHRFAGSILPRMSGIFGLWHRDGSPGGAEFLQAVALSSDVRVAFDGRLDNRGELIAAVAERYAVPPSAADHELLAAAYLCWGVDFAARLAGEFGAAVFDLRAQRLVLARDAVGVGVLYYRCTPRRIAFASRIKAILAVAECSPRPNEQLLAEFLLGRSHRRDADGSTFFNDIASVPPAHVVTVDRERVAIRQYWEFSAHPHPRGMGFEECADGLRHYLQAAVARRMRGTRPVAVSVSGGLDSSAIFSLAHEIARREGPPLLGFTYSTRDGSPADESVYVADLARRTRPIAYLEVPPVVSALRSAREVVRRVEMPMLDSQANRTETLLTTAVNADAGVVMTGHWGDQLLFDQAYLVDCLRAGSWRMVRAHLDEYCRWFGGTARSLFTARLMSDMAAYMLPPFTRPLLRVVRGTWTTRPWWNTWYSDRLRRLASAEGFGTDLRNSDMASAMARALYREVRQRYHALCLEWNAKMAANNGVVLTFPFLDRDLIGFLLGVRGDILVRGGEPKALLRAALKNLLPESIVRRSTKGDFTHGVNEGARADYGAIAQMLSNAPLVVQFGYTTREKLRTGLRWARDGLDSTDSSVASRRLMDMVALEVWLQEFFGDRSDHLEG